MTSFKKLIIYYHSGTGNALMAGKWMIEHAVEKGIECKLLSIDHNYQPDCNDLGDDTLIGFHFPTHGFNLSPAMLKFIIKFPKTTRGTCYLLNTRAGGKFFIWFMPGLSGTAQILPMLILKFKAFKIIGGLPLDLPSNWISVHPGLGPRMTRSIIERRKRNVEAFSEILLNGGKSFRKALITLPIDLVLLPISFLYYILGRFFLAKTFVHTHRCNDCNICVENCPVEAIKLVKGKPFWTYKCESCMRCINICPHKAIQSSHFLALLGILFYQLGFSLLLFRYFPFLKFLKSDLFIFIVDNLVVIGLFYSLYFVMHKVFKLKVFGRFLELTSFTFYWRRYLFPDVKVNHFKQKS